MIDLSGIEWNWGLSFAWWLVPVAVSAVLLWVAVIVDKEWLAITSIFLGVLWLVIGGVWSTHVNPSNSIESQEESMTIQQLEEQGFDHVNLSGSKFTASKDGQFFQGTLFSLGDDKYQVVEVPLD